jgi:type III secretion system YscD/HrpQ family protein
MARLVAEEGLLKGLVLPLEEGEEWIIGRDPDACQLLLEDPAASRKHLLCRSTPQGIVLENLSQSNPVQVNDELLVAPRLLKEGDTVRIGSGMFRFFLDLPKTNPLAQEQAQAEETPAIKAALSAAEDEAHESILEEITDDSETQEFSKINFDIVETGRWLLKVIGGPNNGAEFSMQPGSTYLVGTDPNSCDIVFHDTSVSRQHARIQIEEDESMFIEDLKSRNGTLVDGEPLHEKRKLEPNAIVTTGTTSFLIYDREGNMQTIISPLLPSIVKVLQREKKEPAEEGEKKPEELAPAPLHAAPTAPPKERSLGSLILISTITGMFVLSALGVTSLFKSQPVEVKEIVNVDKDLAEAFTPYPSIKYSFNKATGRLVLFGHLLTAQDKTQLLYSIQGLPFIKSIDDAGVIIDEFVWQETSQVLNRNPNWRGITIQSPVAGQFVLSGSLQTRKEADQLYEYISTNFPYLDRLEKKVVVEEDILNEVNSGLEKTGLINVKPTFRNGEIILAGGIAAAKQEDFNFLVEEFKKIPGVRSVRVQVSSLAPDQAMQNISDRYEVTGFSRIGNNISVIINGRIVTQNDIIDGMTIREIVPGTVFLERDGIKYRIDFSK